MKPSKKLKKKAPMTIRQQSGDDEGMRRLQRAGQRAPGASRSEGDEANKRRYKTIKYVEGERSQGRRASYAEGGKMQGNPDKKAIERRIKAVQGEIGAANRSRYATPEDQKKDIARLQAQLKDLQKKLGSYKDGGKMASYKKGGKFPDLTGDGKVTKADILKGRKVFKAGGKMGDPVKAAAAGAAAGAGAAAAAAAKPKKKSFTKTKTKKPATKGAFTKTKTPIKR